MLAPLPSDHRSGLLVALGTALAAAGLLEASMGAVMVGLATVALGIVDRLLATAAWSLFGLVLALTAQAMIIGEGAAGLLLWIPILLAGGTALTMPVSLAAAMGLAAATVVRIALGQPPEMAWAVLGMTSVAFTAWVALPRHEDEDETSATDARVLEILARGNVRQPLPRDPSPVLEEIRTRLVQLQDRNEQVLETVQDEARYISQTSETQLRSAVELSAAVEQTRVILDRQVELSQSIADIAERVLGRAETVSGHQNAVTDSATNLNAQNERIRGLLSDIQGVARKSEVLALNAALEGARAGELGAGFELVGQEMKRLNESVVTTLRDARQITDELVQATDTTLHHSTEARRLAVENTGLARNIQTTTQEQVASVKEVADAMSDIARVTERSAEENDRTMRRATALLRAVRDLEE